MGPDAGIFAPLMRKPRSVEDFDAERRRSQLDELTLLDAQDKRATTQRTRARADQLDTLVRGLPADATDEQRRGVRSFLRRIFAPRAATGG